MEIIDKAIQEARSALSEFDSKQVLAAYKIPIAKDALIKDLSELDQAVQEIGFPLVMKGCSHEIAHKTEKGLVHIDIRNTDEAVAAFKDIERKLAGADGAALVQEMIKGPRELAVGMTRDPQFGPCVMFGLGGIFTEILKDAAFRVAPLTPRDAMDLMEDIKGKKILEAIRGMQAVDRNALADILMAVGQIGLDHDMIQEIDINPLKILDGKPVAVDALVTLNTGD